MKINDEGDIVAYFLCVDDIFNTFIVLGEEFKESMIVQNVLISLHLIFNVNVSAIEEMKDMKNMKTDELHGIIEMRIEKGNSTMK